MRMGFDPFLIFRRIGEKRRLKKAAEADLSPEEIKILHGRRNFVVDNVSAYVIVSICAGSYLAALLKSVGVANQLNGLILAIPVLAGPMQLIGAALSQGLSSQKKFVMTGIGLQRFSLSVIFLYPLLFGPGLVTSIAMVTTYALGYFAGVAVGPSTGNWLISLLTPKDRAGYFASRERISLLVSAAVIALASFLLDILDAPEHLPWAFAIIGLILMGFSVFNMIKLGSTHEPDTGLVGKRFSLRDLSYPFRNKAFRRVIWVYILWQATTQISVPFMGLYYIDTIGISFSVIGLVTFIVTVERALIVEFWARFALRFGWDKVLSLAVAFFALSQFILIFLSSGNAIVIYTLAQIVVGIANSTMSIGLFNYQYSHLDMKRSTVYVGVCGAVSGLTGYGFALLGSFVLNMVKTYDINFSGHKILLIISVFLALIMVLVPLELRKKRAKKDNLGKTI